MLQALTYFLKRRLRRYVLYALRSPQWYWNSRQSRRITVQSKQGVYTFDSKDSGIGLYLFCFGEYESDLNQCVLDILKSEGQLNTNSVLLDIGANIGTTSVAMLLANAMSKALAIEPVPANFELLQQNASSNQLTHRMLTRQIAISDHAGDVTMELNTTLHGDHRVRVSSSAINRQDLFQESSRPIVSVQSIPLDQLLIQESIAPTDIGLVWIDVQGHEGYVIKSGHALFSQKPPTLIELWKYGIEQSGMSIENFCELISRYWSTCYVWKHGQFIKHATSEIPKLIAEQKPSAFENILLMA
jgi:FkbM family methyltransferase